MTEVREEDAGALGAYGGISIALVVREVLDCSTPLDGRDRGGPARLTLPFRRGAAPVARVARVALIAALVAACGPEPAADPSPVVSRFYATHLTAPAAGAPDSAHLATLAPYLSDTLRALLREADRLRAREARRAPDEKPPFADGDLFSSLFEGPTGATVAGRDSAGGVQRVLVQLAYHHADPVRRWTDTVIVVRQADRWVVDDIRYGGAWDFANRGSLRASLEEVLRDPPAGSAGPLPSAQ